MSAYIKLVESNAKRWEQHAELERKRSETLIKALRQIAFDYPTPTRARAIAHAALKEAGVHAPKETRR